MAQFPSMDQLIRQAQSGDQSALNQLVTAWYSKIYHYSWKYFIGKMQAPEARFWAQEAAQKTFVKMVDALPSLKEPQKFRPWLYRIATNYCRQELRSMGSRPSEAWTTEKVSSTETMPWQSPSLTPEAQLQQQELTTLLQEALSHLPEEQQVVLIMKEYEGLKFREIAEVLAISENTVKSRLYYGLKHLRKKLEHMKHYAEYITYE